jgi:hypothetical protein
MYVWNVGKLLQYERRHVTEDSTLFIWMQSMNTHSTSFISNYILREMCSSHGGNYEYYWRLRGVAVLSGRCYRRFYLHCTLLADDKDSILLRKVSEHLLYGSHSRMRHIFFSKISSDLNKVLNCQGLIPRKVLPDRLRAPNNLFPNGNWAAGMLIWPSLPLLSLHGTVLRHKGNFTFMRSEGDRTF